MKGGLMHADGYTAVLLDKHPMWLDALGCVLEDIEIQIPGKATTPTDALRLIRDERPDLFVLDIETNGHASDGLTCLREAMTIAPSMKTVVVSGSDDPQRIDAALGAGAAAYVLKTAESGDLTSAIRQVFARSLYLAGASSTSMRAPMPNVAGLTRREQEILQFVAEGSTNGEVAKQLWVTEQTVKFHLANIFRKLDVTNRTQASRWAHEHGLLAEHSFNLVPA
jgi:DNA-binding NarL/FixJ family response regulator